MQVKCTICDQEEILDNDSIQAKRLINRRLILHLCHECHDRITHKTNARHATGKFKLYKSNDEKDLI